MSPDPDAVDPAAAPEVTVVGPGRVGQSLALSLASTGLRVALHGRSRRPPETVSGSTDVVYRRGISPPSGTLVFTVPDDALASAVRDWAEADAGTSAREGGSNARVALHTSGVHPAASLSGLRDAGRAVATWHPLTAVAAPAADAFRGVAFGVEGDPDARDRARDLARRVGGRALPVTPGEHARYHAAAVFASNHLVACLGMAADLLGDATGGRAGAEDLLPLARSALENVAEHGLERGLTGPVARGDAETVARHLEALPPEHRSVYRGLARELLRISGDRVPDGAAEAIRRVLEDAPLSDPEGDPPS